MSDLSQSLSGIRVLEFSHAVMGPSCGLILADLGAEVIKVEPSEGDHTRRLTGFGSGFFTVYNRNKKSIVLDVKTAGDLEQAYRLVETADVLIENFAPGTMDRLDLGYEKLSKVNPRLVYCALKGFLAGPYEHRMALDEVVQMMCGLAYVTGMPGKPMRAGASVLDVLAGTFGAVGILAALNERAVTGQGKLVQAGLFETGAFLMAQHMAYAAIEGAPVPTMAERTSAWGIYDLFHTQDDSLVFIGITSDSQWARFCEVFNRPDLLSDSRLQSNQDRIQARAWMLPNLQSMMAQLPQREITRLCDQAHIPFAPVERPESLFYDPHLVEGGHLVRVRLSNGEACMLPALPVNANQDNSSKTYQPPALGEHTDHVLEDLVTSLSEGNQTPVEKSQKSL